MKKIWKALALVFVMTMVLGACGQKAAPAPSESASPETAAEVKLPEKLIMGVDDSFPPMGFRDDNDEIIGFDIDLAQAVAEKLGVTIEIQPVNWATKEQELNTKKIDLIWNGYTINDERKAQVEFTDPYLKNNQVVVVKKDSGISTYADLAGKKLGLQTGSTAEEALDGEAELKDSLAEIVSFEENMMALLDLDKGGVDAIAVDEVVANYYIAQENFDFVLLDQKLEPEEYGIGFRKEDAAIAEVFTQALKDLKADGTVKEIAEKWFGTDEAILIK